MRGHAKTYGNFLKKVSFWKKIRILWYNNTHTVPYSPYPLSAKIEINSTCNLNCVMCLRNSLKRPDRFMSLEEFKRILDEIPSLIEWSAHGYNEPMLHPQFFEFIEEANKRKIFFTLVTNATLLDKERADKLMSLNPRQVIVSIDGVGRTYEEIRRGASYMKVLQNISYFVNIVKNSDTRFSLYATIWKDNIDQIPELVKLSQQLECPISFSDITWLYETGTSTKDNSIRENQTNGQIKAIKEHYKDLLDVSISLGRVKKRTCTLAWSSVYVDVSGDIYPCTDNLQWKMGNIFTEKFNNIFNNQKYREFRVRSFLGLDFVNCTKCQSWSVPTQFNVNHDKLKESVNI